MFLIVTETHTDHTDNHFILPSRATLISVQGPTGGTTKECNPVVLLDVIGTLKGDNA